MYFGMRRSGWRTPVPSHKSFCFRTGDPGFTSGIRRLGIETIPYMLRVLRATGSAVAYLHDAGQTHGALSPDTIYVTPTGRVWILGWQWALPAAEIPPGVRPDPFFTPPP